MLKADFRDGAFSGDLERIFAEQLVRAIQQLKDSINSAEVQTAIRQSIEASVLALDAIFAAADIGAIVDLMTKEIIKAGLEQVPTLPKSATIRPAFDVSDPRAIQWARRRAGQLISTINDEARLVVQSVTERLLNGELSLSAARGEIGRSVGLHDRWQKAVENSYEKTFESLIDAGIDPDTAAEMAGFASDKYASRLLRSRASNIARTEVATAQNQGRYLGWQQAAEDGLFRPEDVKKEWRTAPEFVSSKTDVCPICEPLDGVQIGIWEEFPDVGVVMPPAHPNCRCRAVLIPPSIEAIAEQIAAARLEYNY